MDYKRKIDFAIKLLRAIPKDGPVEISYSGGKDSDVILELAKMAGIDFRAIYKNTTIDPPGTIQHCKDMGAEILAPRQRFKDIIAERGFPNRWRRFCCSILKEYKVLDRAVHGIRREESLKRAARYKEPETCRLYPNKEKVRVYYPILEWTLEDVARFIEERGIGCAPVYYDERGCFHPERRLGCLCCPLQSINHRREEFKRYPGILKLYLRGGAKFLINKPEGGAARKFDADPYKLLFFHIFCDSYEGYKTGIDGGLFPETAIDPKRYMEDYFGIDLTLKEK